MSEIVKLLFPKPQDLKELREIFFESSTRKDFSSPVEKEAFYRKYLGIYLERFPDLVYVAKSDRILGYMVASPISEDAELYEIQPHLKTFEPYFEKFPAHLHVNFHSDARGLGLGSKLFSELERELQRLKIRGIHIMTSPDSRNKSFYQRLGFDFEVNLIFQGAPILMMGKSL